MKKGRGRLLLLLCVFALCITGCARGVPRKTLLLPEDAFSVELTGTLGDVPFAARLEIGAEREGKRNFSLRFLPSDGGLPARLALEGVCSTDGVLTKDVTATIGELSVTVGADTVRELLLPVTVLLSQLDYRTVQKTDTGYLLLLPDGAEVLLDQNGLPLSYSSSKCSFTVTGSNS